MRRRAQVVLVAAFAVVLVTGMVVWACTNLATLNLSKANGQPGTTVDVTGSSFRSPAAGGQEVLIRWDAVDGAVLARVAPDQTGSIATRVRVPASAQPGYHVLIATQMEAGQDGVEKPAYGTPARASFLVGGVLPEQPSAVTAAATGTIGDTSSTGLIVLTILLAIAGIGIFGASLGLFVREVRRRAVPAPVKRQE